MITIEEVQANNELMNDFITENMGLVGLALKKTGFPLTDDYRQEGAIGLLKAVRKFDTSRGVQFSTYAVPTIIGEIRRYVRNYTSADNVSGMNVSRELKGIYFKSLKFDGYDDAEICKELNITLEQLEEARVAMSYCRSLDKDSHSEDSGDKATEVYGLIPSKENVEDDVIDNMFFEEFMAYTGREFGEEAVKVLNLYLSNELTQTEVSNLVGMSQVQVSRIFKRVIKNYKQFNEGGTNLKISIDQLINECREHGTDEIACRYIAKKYNMASGSVKNGIFRNDIKKLLSQEQALVHGPINIVHGPCSEVKKPVETVQPKKVSEPIKWHEDKCVPTLKVRAWDGKENTYSFQEGKLVISNKEGALAVTDFKAMINELQELIAKSEAV